MDEEAHQRLMRMHREWLGDKISEILVATSPNYSKVTLRDTILDPVVAHVNGFSSLCFKGICREADGTLVVAEE